MLWHHPMLRAAIAAQAFLRTPFPYGLRSTSGFIMSFPAVTEEQKANAKVLEPAFEALLRSVDLAEDLITVLRVRKVTDRERFSSLEQNKDKFRETILSACGINNTIFEHKLETAKLVKAWRTASLQAQTKAKGRRGSEKRTENPRRCSRKIGLRLCASLQRNLAATSTRRTCPPNPSTRRSRRNGLRVL